MDAHGTAHHVGATSHTGVTRNKATIDSKSARVFVVDDDPDVRRSICLLAQSVNLAVESFANASEFLGSEIGPGCLVLDVRMPGMTGLELQQNLIENGCFIPIILLTGHAEVSMATQAMRAGAVDFMQKPFSPQQLLERIHEAIQIDACARVSKSERARVAELTSNLSPRENEVMQLLATGLSTKMIAKQLGISTKTVDNHRAHVLEKMLLDNTAQLAAMVAKLD